MCGIAGFLGPTDQSDPVTVLRAMTGKIAHRGPDGEDFFVQAPVYLGHRRLAIIDVVAGIQPMSNEDGTIWIVYNGEIFNHRELRPDLECRGHRYKSHCDTETILHLYEEYGEKCLDKLRGMFSFVICDLKRKKLFGARDRLGKKPFYYAFNGRNFVFGSEIKAILAHPAISPRFRPAILPEYLSFGYISSSHTFFEGIEKLPAGHYLELQWDDLGASAPRIVRYWDPPVCASVDTGRSDRDWIDECRVRMEETVRSRLMSDVPLGVFLSGGVDSSAIAALVQRQISKPLHTFSVGYAEAAYSELGFAQTVARHLGTSHHEVRVSREDFFAALPRLIWHEDEPIAWPSSVALHFVSSLAAQRVKVVLTGEGSDEIFGGYARYQSYLLNSRLAPFFGAVPSMLRDGLRAWLDSSRMLDGNLRRKLQHTILGRELNMESLYADNYYSAFSPAELKKLLRPGEWGNPYENFLGYWNSQPFPDLLSQMLYTDQKTYLIELLMKQDQMSMSASIESRVPLLDHTFVEFAASIPAHLKIRGRRGKHIFKESVADLLPASIVDRPKMGFPTPLRSWFALPESQKMFQSFSHSDSWLSEYIRPEPVAALLESHRSGEVDATDRLWRLVNLQSWGDTFLSGRSTPPPDLVNTSSGLHG